MVYNLLIEIVFINILKHVVYYYPQCLDIMLCVDFNFFCPDLNISFVNTGGELVAATRLLSFMFVLGLFTLTKNKLILINWCVIIFC